MNEADASLTSIPHQTPWRIQRSVIFACFIREINARFGRLQFGYFWALAEPIMYILVSSLIRGRFTGAPHAGLPTMVFFTSGVLPFLLFRNIVNGSVSVIENNMSLFNYQRVKPIDVFLARAMVDLMTKFAVGAILFTGFYLAGIRVTFNSFLLSLAALGTLLALACGMGLIALIIGPLWPDSKKVVHAINRPLLFVSGVFFTASSIPQALRDWALYNPLVHAFELLRGALFVDYTSHEGSWTYLLSWTIGSLLVGLIVYRLFRVKVVTSGYLQ